MEDMVRPIDRVRRRFKYLVRRIYDNRYWLEDDDEDSQMTSNVLLNVQRLTHRKKGYKMVLTLKQKALLNKAAEHRTEEELELLSKIIGNFNCFSRYPPHVKDKLAGVCYFVYYGPGRTIVRQHQPAEGLYYILTGDVSVYKYVFDELENVTKEIRIGVLAAGSMFGEVALLHDLPRQATIVTNTDCELLKMMKDDFNQVLKHTLLKKWEEIHMSMHTFSYFNDWDSMTIRECCIVSRIKKYNPGQVIGTKDKGVASLVYFVLSGQCEVVEELQMTVTENSRGVKSYFLRDPADNIEPDKDTESLKSQKSIKFSLQQLVVKDEHMTAYHKALPSHHAVMFKRDSEEPKGGPSKGKKKTIEKRFMRVCLLNKKASFGFGELSESRFVVATTKTVCLAIPRYFLLNHNRSNIWTRIRRFLQQHIPGRQVVFNRFVLDQKWRQYKKDLMNSIITKPPVNSMSNIPYSIRLREDYGG